MQMRSEKNWNTNYSLCIEVNKKNETINQVIFEHPANARGMYVECGATSAQRIIANNNAIQSFQLFL